MDRDTQLCCTGYALDEYLDEHGHLPLAEFDVSQRDVYWTIVVGTYEAGTDTIPEDAYAPERLRSDNGRITDTTTRFFPAWHVNDPRFEGILIIEGPMAAAYEWQEGPTWSVEEVIGYYVTRPDLEFWVLFDNKTAGQVSMTEIIEEGD